MNLIMPKQSTPGLEEELLGIEQRKNGEDKEALTNFYIAIEKGLDAPALYRETALLLRKLDMLEEELRILELGIERVTNSGSRINPKHIDWLKNRREKLIKKMEKEK